MERKKQQQEHDRMVKIMKEEMKEKEKMMKREQRMGKFENWIKRQAHTDEIKALEKREIDERKREEEIKKKAEEEQRMILSQEAFKEWRERKHKFDQSARKNSDKNMQTQNKNRSSNGLKIVIGPYTNAKILREIQKKINTMENSDVTQEEVDNEIEELKNESSNAIDKSLNNISSINKENHSY
jgi:hypothetical protein